MPQLSVSQKALFGFSTLVLLVAATGAVGYVASERLFRQLDRTTSHTLPSLELLLQIDRDLQQALVAERTTLLVTPGSAEAQRLLAEHGENLQQAQERWQRLTALGLPAGTEELVSLYEGRFDQWARTSHEVLQAHRAAASSRDSAPMLASDEAAQFEAARGCLDDLTGMLLEECEAERLEAIATRRNAGITVGAVTGFSVLVGMALAWLLGIRLPRALRDIASALGAGAQQNAEAAEQISSASHTLAQGATEQAASLEETSAALNELSGMTRRNGSHVESARSCSRETRAAASRGAREMDEMSRAVAAIQQSSNNIAAIIKTIDEIAFQTNLLALNAAVEAARAGAAGAGFSVVADEVCSLAHRSALAARETAEKIDESLRTSREGTALAARVASCLQEIDTRTAEVDRIIDEIATASEQQARGIDQVTAAVGQIDIVTQKNAAAAEESASSSAELSEQAAQLNTTMLQLNALLGAVEANAPATKQAETPAPPADLQDRKRPTASSSWKRPAPRAVVSEPVAR